VPEHGSSFYACFRRALFVFLLFLVVFLLLLLLLFFFCLFYALFTTLLALPLAIVPTLLFKLRIYLLRSNA
jgi:hypothetical protein